MSFRFCAPLLILSQREVLCPCAIPLTYTETRHSPASQTLLFSVLVGMASTQAVARKPPSRSGAVAAHLCSGGSIAVMMVALGIPALTAPATPLGALSLRLRGDYRPSPWSVIADAGFAPSSIAEAESLLLHMTNSDFLRAYPRAQNSTLAGPLAKSSLESAAAKAAV